MEDCKRARVKVDGDYVYVIIGKEFAMVTGRFENRARGEQSITREGSEKINKTIDDVRRLLE